LKPNLKKIFLIVTLLIASLVGFSAVSTITNVSFTFNPASLTINVGDGVDFVFDAKHNAVEESQATWNSNGNNALPGGFSVPFGGGSVLPFQLTAGTHWYVCSHHASS
jgi:plastocyanin